MRPGCIERLLQTRKDVHKVFKLDKIKRLFASKRHSVQPGRIALQSASRFHIITGSSTINFAPFGELLTALILP
jgi:hypothetical protein